MKIFTKKDQIIIESKVLNLKSEKSILVERKIQLESSLIHCHSQYEKTSFKSDKFNEIKDRRRIIKNQLSEIELEIRNKNEQIRDANKLKNEIDLFIAKNKILFDTDFEKMIFRIDKLKSKYKEFAKDRTRIASLRIMASEFIEELENILK